jgi:Ubiquitin carboxyl-terminal hydrolase
MSSRNLDLLPYMSPSALDANQSPSATYDLYAVVNHYGNLFSGHYTAYAQCLGPTGDDKPEIGNLHFNL